MNSYTIATTLSRPYAATVEAVREALGEQGFGILTEIDLKATMKTKLGVDVASQVILGACRPALTYEALTVEPSIAAVLPCNVVVRALDEQTSLVEAFDPDAMMGLANNDALSAGAASRPGRGTSPSRSAPTDAKDRLATALASLASPEGDN